MKTTQRITFAHVRWVVVAAILIAVLAASWVGSAPVSANHPVLVEGNCESPIPGTTIVTTAGTCGDYDGDGRVGTAEDTDGADRIFGTINAAMGPGTGAAAGTGANHNGKVLIVTSGRFAEAVYIGLNQAPGQPGVANPGNVILEAAPGVEAVIDAVLQGDPAGSNGTRQGGTGIQIVYSAANRFVILRNLQIRNFSTGITLSLNARVQIDNCRLDSNLNYGIRMQDTTQAVVSRSQITGTGYRVGGPTDVAAPGHAMSVEINAQARVEFTTISYSAGAAIMNTTGNPNNVSVYKLGAYFNAAGTLAGNGGVVAPNPNFAF